MKPVGLKELKAELSTLSPAKLAEICIRIARFKKENKELLTYLLFQSADEAAYIVEVEDYISEQFEEVNRTNSYLTKKSLRKILKTTNRYIKYSGSKQTEVELLIFFCRKLRDSGIPLQSSKPLWSLYERLIQRIAKTLHTLDEDLQYDYSKEVADLVLPDYHF